MRLLNKRREKVERPREKNTASNNFGCEQIEFKYQTWDNRHSVSNNYQNSL
jgi:hypothetical protein